MNEFLVFTAQASASKQARSSQFGLKHYIFSSARLIRKQPNKNKLKSDRHQARIMILTYLIARD